MAVGLQTFNASGVLMLDATYRIGRILAAVTTGTANGSVVVPGLSSAGTPFVFTTSDEDSFTSIYVHPGFTISGNSVTWTFNDFENPNYPYGTAPRRSVVASIGAF